jgi:uncharacterized membrane protein
VELLIVLLILLLLAVPIAAIVGVVMAVGTRDQLRGFERRLVALERRLDAPPAAVAAPRPAAPVRPTEQERLGEPQPISAPPPDVRPVRAPEPEPPAPAPARPSPKPDRALPPKSPAGPAPPAKGFEERFGTQWVVWVGGLALALGGFFLVRLSIEQGLIGPGVRIVLGALLAIALIAAGEWARRSERVSGIAGLPSAHIPSILTAVGTTIAYADVYAASDH